MQNTCAEIKIRAERRIGEFSRDLDKSKGGKPFHKSYSTHDGQSKNKILQDAGIKHHERYEAIADIPEETFEKHITEIKSAGEELTSASGVYFEVITKIWGHFLRGQ